MSKTRYLLPSGGVDKIVAEGVDILNYRISLLIKKHTPNTMIAFPPVEINGKLYHLGYYKGR